MARDAVPARQGAAQEGEVLPAPELDLGEVARPGQGGAEQEQQDLRQGIEHLGLLPRVLRVGEAVEQQGGGAVHRRLQRRERPQPEPHPLGNLPAIHPIPLAPQRPWLDRPSCPQQGCVSHARATASQGTRLGASARSDERPVGLRIAAAVVRGRSAGWRPAWASPPSLCTSTTSPPWRTRAGRRRCSTRCRRSSSYCSARRWRGRMTSPRSSAGAWRT
jgi:hypothetical protein